MNWLYLKLQTQKQPNMKKITLMLFAIATTLFAVAINPNKDNYTYSVKSSSDYDKFGIGFGIGFGFFNPEDVNNWLENEYSRYTEVTNLSIYMNENIALVASFRPIEMLRVNLSAEAGIAPKLIITDDRGTKYHNFGRYSGGIEAYLNVPIGSGRHSILFGVGSFYHYMYFEEYSGNTIGVRVIPFGMSFGFRKTQLQLLLGGDLLASANDTRGYTNFNLNYNHGFIHINFLF